ncbi:oxidoreductase [Actinomadura sp. HBU206391]|uniref:oxidoreductase n=1 Tax=Actinomadura sp. HBU206391 TaxID=2731692 RepID=UPI001650A0A1|nr:oxidoreductase [Actinomadura sp. HBU206391]MBC6456570.1 SDR family NAD(P)-dependent oxidoreductase [Actinomadura sp. HBU206391]
MSHNTPGRRWTAADMPDQRGRTVVITGANTGIGFETARAFARHGATVVLACRNPGKAADAAARIRTDASEAKLSTLQLDLASLASVHRAAGRLRTEHARIDLLINNAGGIRTRYGRTEDGFELTLATNHLGPFALTGLVLDRLLAVPGSRVVTVSSIGHRRGTINFDDLQSQRGYRSSTAYFQSKLANLMFTYELQRRLTAAGAQTIAVAAHPGNARTEFGREMSPFVRIMMSPRLRMFTWWLMQSPPMGALAALRAAVDPDASGGDYYGPPGRAQFTGFPTRVESSALSHDGEAQRRLWRESERLTGITYSTGESAGRQATPI